MTSLPVPMFLFELAIEELKSYTNSSRHMITARFGDVFTLKLKDPNVFAMELARERGRPFKKKKRKGSAKSPDKKSESPVAGPLPLPGATVLVTSDVQSLVSQMMQYPIELAIYSKDNPYTLGFAELPWSSVHIDYVRNIEQNRLLPPAATKEVHRIYDEYTSKRVATVKLRIKLSILDTANIETKPFPANLGPNWNLQGLASPEQLGVVKTIYSSGKSKYRARSHKRYFSDTMTAIENDNEEKHKVKPIPIASYEEQGKVDSSPIPNSPITDGEELDNQLMLFNKKSIDSIVLAEDKNELYLKEEYIKDKLKNYTKPDNSFASLARSQTEIENTKLVTVTKHWSSSSLEIKQRLDTLNYIFGNMDGPFGSQVYCVGYFTVDNDGGGGSKSSPAPLVGKDNDVNNDQKNIVKNEDKDVNYSFKICGSECKVIENTNPCFDNTCKFDLPKEATRYITIKRCQNKVDCDYKRTTTTLLPKDDPIILTFEGQTDKDCCKEKIEEVVEGTVTTKMTELDDPCLCTCECTFGFLKKTTYCAICGGYELLGDELKANRPGPPFPCPIYHKLGEKGKKTLAGRLLKTKSLDDAKDSSGAASRRKIASNTGTPDEKRSVESEKEGGKKKKLKQKDDRFKFNYGYKGIPPTIGHSQCALPCTGNLNPVPKHMGWLWTADNIPGLKPRPGWRPGAANKHVVRQLRIARFPEKVLKKRKKSMDKKKRPLKRPLLVVEKKDGEYFVTMETMKTYNKPRAVNQAPYEEKPAITYKVGRTDEENKERAKRRARAQRRLEREQRAFIQSTFHDMCREICLKTYQQALGMLPFAEDPLCGCYPIEPPADRVDYSHSCSCTESERSSGSATDDDEWIVEFTPPNAYFDPAFKGKRIIKVDTGTQYTYLDYRIKKLDRYGNQVIRFFKGPDGKTLCSDLGGFWDSNKKWQEINEDGIIGDDGRWQPNCFIGPCGEQVDAENGKFQATNGVWLIAGVDGYIEQGVWHFYPDDKEPNKDSKKQVKNIDAWIKAGGCISTPDETAKPSPVTMPPPPNGPPPNVPHIRASEATLSCFGNASPTTLTNMGILGHGHDRRLLVSTLEQMIARGEKVKVPQPKVPKGRRRRRESYRMSVTDRVKIRHNPPTTKRIIAVNDHGLKTHFKLKDYKNPRSKQRIQVLDEEGISLSSYHVPCFSSFISTEETRQKTLAHIQRHNEKVMQSLGIQTQ